MVALFLVASAYRGSTDTLSGSTSSPDTPTTETATDSSFDAEVKAVVEAIIAPTGNLSTTPVEAESRQLIGTHGNGSFTATLGGGEVQGTYTASQIRGEWESIASMVGCQDFPDAGNLHVFTTTLFAIDRTSPPAP